MGTAGSTRLLGTTCLHRALPACLHGGKGRMEAEEEDRCSRQEQAAGRRRQRGRAGRAVRTAGGSAAYAGAGRRGCPSLPTLLALPIPAYPCPPCRRGAHPHPHPATPGTRSPRRGRTVSTSPEEQPVSPPSPCAAVPVSPLQLTP